MIIINIKFLYNPRVHSANMYLNMEDNTSCIEWNSGMKRTFQKAEDIYKEALHLRNAGLPFELTEEQKAEAAIPCNLKAMFEDGDPFANDSEGMTS